MEIPVRAGTTGVWFCVWFLIPVLGLTDMLQGSELPPVGSVLTNALRQPDGTYRSKRFRVTTGLIPRTSQVAAMDPQFRVFSASEDQTGVGTHIADLPDMVLVVSQTGIVRATGTPDPFRSDGWPQKLVRFDTQVSSADEFLKYGPRSVVPSGSLTYQIVAGPVFHPGVRISKRPDLNADDLYEVSIDYLSGIVAESAENRARSYIIANGSNLVVAGSVPADPAYFVQIPGSTLAASPSAHGLIQNPSLSGSLEDFPFLLDRPLFNVCWGAEFVGVEELKDEPIRVVLSDRVVINGLQVRYAPLVPVESRLETAPDLGGPWTVLKNVAAGASLTLIESKLLKEGRMFIRLVPVP